jgi:hypothetical protein
MMMKFDFERFMKDKRLTPKDLSDLLGYNDVQQFYNTRTRGTLKIKTIKERLQKKYLDVWEYTS